MLTFILGPSGSGKSRRMLAELRTRAENGQRSLLIVPEQFTSSTEGRIYRELGDALSGMVESFSFTSLAEKILSTEGGAAVQTLSDAGRAVLVRRALEELQDNVHYYHRHRRSAAFCQMAAQTIDELKSVFRAWGLKMTIIRRLDLIRCCFPTTADPVVKGAYCNVVFTTPVSICHAALTAFIDKSDLFHHRNAGLASTCHNLSSIIVVK